MDKRFMGLTLNIRFHHMGALQLIRQCNTKIKSHLDRWNPIDFLFLYVMLIDLHRFLSSSPRPFLLSIALMRVDEKKKWANEQE